MCVVGMVTVESLGRGFVGGVGVGGRWWSWVCGCLASTKKRKGKGEKGRLANSDAVFVFVQKQ